MEKWNNRAWGLAADNSLLANTMPLDRLKNRNTGRIIRLGHSIRIGLGGPVGLCFASTGFAAAVLVARVWETVAQEAHCVPACPTFESQLLRLHHFYFGLGLLLPSLASLLLAKRQRLRWDLSLVFGIGIGLFADEVGLLLLRVPYSHPLSVAVLAVTGGVLTVGTVHAALRDGTREFRVLDRTDTLSLLSILLSMGAVLYLDRPLTPLVESAGAISGVLGLILLVLYGKRHFIRTWKGLG